MGTTWRRERRSHVWSIVRPCRPKGSIGLTGAKELAYHWSARSGDIVSPYWYHRIMHPLWLRDVQDEFDVLLALLLDRYQPNI